MRLQSESNLSLIRLPDVSLDFSSARPKDGPLTILLHGFPEFWFGWRHQIDLLAQAGLHFVAPDERGYNHSSKLGENGGIEWLPGATHWLQHEELAQMNSVFMCF